MYVLMPRTHHVVVLPMVLTFEIQVPTSNAWSPVRLLLVRWQTDGCTPLHIACSKGHADVVTVLLANRATVTIVST
jgi:hypothetical protein